MAIQPRDYQIAACDSVPDYFMKKAGNPLICMPTGTGKSIVIAMLIRAIMKWPNQRVIVATHVKELIAQNHAKLMDIWPDAPAGIYSAGLGRKDKFHPITFVGIASVAKHAEEFGCVNILFIDEAHLVSPKDSTGYRKFIEGLKKRNPLLKVIGLTATPYRLGYGSLVQQDEDEEELSLFTDVCFDLTTMQAFNWLIAEGYLSMLLPKRTTFELDTKGVGKQGGEFKQGELQLAVDRESITRQAMKECVEVATAEQRHHWLVFCAGVEHAIHTADMLNKEFGVRAIAIHSKMTPTERDQGVKLWKEGYYTAAVNNNVLTTGIDFPEIDMIGMLRPTLSTVLWVQMLGRGTRPVYAPGYDLSNGTGRLASIAAGPKPNCRVLDFSGNSRRLGPINDPVQPRKRGGSGGEAPVKECPMCRTYNHATARFCIECGHEFIFAVKIVQSADTRDLIKSDLPVTKVFPVDQITYVKFERSGQSPAVRVNYFCKLRKFTEFVSIQGIGGSRGLATRWWNARARNMPMPSTVDEFLQIASNLPPATHIRVWTNKHPYPQIMDHCFDGTAFSTEQATNTPVHVQVEQPVVFDPSENLKNELGPEFPF